MEARNSLIEANLLLVVKVALRYKSVYKNISLMDLIEDGNLGLFKAADKFDPSKNFRFSTYAIWWIKQKIQTALTQSTGNFSLPANITEQIKQIKNAENELSILLERQPTQDEIAEKLGKSIETIRWLEGINQALYKISDPENSETSIVDNLVSAEDSPQEALNKKQTKEDIETLLQTLNLKELQIIKIRNGIGMDWEEIAIFLRANTELKNITTKEVMDLGEQAKDKLTSFDGSLSEIIYAPTRKIELTQLLDKYEILIVKVRNCLDVTLQEIADVLCITRERVRQIENEAIKKLKVISILSANARDLLRNTDFIEFVKNNNNNPDID